MEKQPVEVADIKGIPRENGLMITTRSFFLKELNKELGRTTDRQFRFQPMTTKDRI